MATAVFVAVAAPALASFGTGSSVRQVVATGVLAPPTGLAATEGKCVNNKSTAVVLSWTPSASSFASGYAVWRSEGGGSFVQVGTAGPKSATTFTDTTVSFATAYTYELRALRAGWTSAPSTHASLTTSSHTCH